MAFHSGKGDAHHPDLLQLCRSLCRPRCKNGWADKHGRGYGYGHYRRVTFLLGRYCLPELFFISQLCGLVSCGTLVAHPDQYFAEHQICVIGVMMLLVSTFIHFRFKGVVTKLMYLCMALALILLCQFPGYCWLLLSVSLVIACARALASVHPGY